MIDDILQPETHTLKTIIVGDIVYYQTAMRLSVMCLSDCSVFLCPCRVPQLHLNSRSIFHAHIFGCEFDSNRGISTLRNDTSQVSTQQTCLPNGDITNHNNYIHQTKLESIVYTIMLVYFTVPLNAYKSIGLIKS